MPGGAEPRVPPFDLIKLYDVVAKNWVLQEIYRVIIQETKRPGWIIQPKFKVKCRSCGAEYQISQKKCLVCNGKAFKEPNVGQRLKLERLLARPNSNRDSFGDILGSIIYHDIVADDWYIGIDYAKMTDGDLIPAEIKVLDPRFLKPIVDEYGRLGNSKQWVCPVHWRYQQDPLRPEEVVDVTVYDKSGACPICGLELVETAYIQEVSGTITARWGKNQVVHGSTYRVLPGLFGAPRARSLWNVIHAVQVMDEWFIDTFREGRLAKIVNFPGWEQAKLTELMRRIQADVQELKALDRRSGQLRPRKTLRTIMLGSKEPIGVFDVGISPQDIQLLDYYRLCIQACAGVYGVQIIFISDVERKGRASGTPAMRIEVQNRTIQEVQRDKEEIFVGQLFPIFGIHDWALKFGPLEKRDKVREAEIRQRDSGTALTLLNAGFDVWWDEFNELQWSKKPTKDPVSRRPSSATSPKKKISDTSGQEIEGTTTERFPAGPRAPTPQDEEREKT